MDKVLYILVVVFLFSCKSNSVAQEKETEKTKPKIEKPKFSDIIDHNRIDPNTVHLVAVIKDVFTNANVCGKSYKATILVEVKSITGSGSSIVNLISVGQKITFAYRNAAATDFELLKKDFNKDQEVSLIIKEGLCPDMGQNTVYEILRFKFSN